MKQRPAFMEVANTPGYLLGAMSGEYYEAQLEMEKNEPEKMAKEVMDIQIYAHSFLIRHRIASNVLARKINGYGQADNNLLLSTQMTRLQDAITQVGGLTGYVETGDGFWRRSEEAIVYFVPEALVRPMRNIYSILYQIGSCLGYSSGEFNAGVYAKILRNMNRFPRDFFQESDAFPTMYPLSKLFLNERTISDMPLQRWADIKWEITHRKGADRLP